jgi:hypothetical protein
VLPDPEYDPADDYPPELKDYFAIAKSEDYEEETIKDTEPPYYVVAYVRKSKSLNKKIVVRNHHTNEVWEPTGEIRGKSVTNNELIPYAYDDDIGEIKMSIVGSRFIDITIHQE